MKHPEIVLLPILMFTDYYLTVTGAILKERKYADHFKTEHYELNPNFQKEIAAIKWFSPRHFLGTLFLTGFVFLIVGFDWLPSYFAEGILGYFLILFATVVGRHIGNILTFIAVDRVPDQLTGQITMTHAFALTLSTVSYFVVLVPLAILALFTRAPYVVGGLLGIVMLILTHLRWLAAHRAKIGKQKREDSAV